MNGFSTKYSLLTRQIDASINRLVKAGVDPVVSSIEDRTGTAKAFGAKVDLKSNGAVLCLVVGRVSPIAAINAAQGSVAATLSRTRVLAVMDLVLLSQLQKHPDVLLAGPVNIDQGRFAQFARLVGVTNGA